MAPRRRHYRKTRLTRPLHPNPHRAPNVQHVGARTGTRWRDRLAREHEKAASRPSGKGPDTTRADRSRTEAFRYAQCGVVGTRGRRGVADREHAHAPGEQAVSNKREPAALRMSQGALQGTRYAMISSGAHRNVCLATKPCAPRTPGGLSQGAIVTPPYARNSLLNGASIEYATPAIADTPGMLMIGNRRLAISRSIPTRRCCSLRQPSALAFER